MKYLLIILFITHSVHANWSANYTVNPITNDTTKFIFIMSSNKFSPDLSNKDSIYSTIVVVPETNNAGIVITVHNANIKYDSTTNMSNVKIIFEKNIKKRYNAHHVCNDVIAIIDKNETADIEHNLFSHSSVVIEITFEGKIGTKRFNFKLK